MTAGTTNLAAANFPLQTLKRATLPDKNGNIAFLRVLLDVVKL